MERIRACAQLSLQRGIAFALLAIGMTVLAFSFDAPLALQIGAALCLLVFLVLFFRSLEAPSRDYRKTEVWILLDKQLDLPVERAQGAIGGVLQELYRRYAGYMLGAAVVQWLLSLVLRLT